MKNANVFQWCLGATLLAALLGVIVNLGSSYPGQESMGYGLVMLAFTIFISAGCLLAAIVLAVAGRKVVAKKFLLASGLILLLGASVCFGGVAVMDAL